MKELNTINFFGEEIKSLNIITVSETEELSIKTDSRLLVDSVGVTVTLNFDDNEEGAKIEIYAFEDCTVNYYTTSSATASLAMQSGTHVSFIYHNGWNYSGMYGAVWN